MKKKTIRLGLVVLSFSVLFGCAAAHPGLVNGGLYSGYSMGSSGTAAGGAKKGEACAMSILGIIGIGDASIGAAAQSGGVGQITAVDHDAFNILGLYGSVCTVVSGN